MALIYTKLTDKTTVLAPREGACRKFNFGTDWTEMRIGAFISAVAATGSNDNTVTESMAPATVTDYCTFGIKDDSQTYPGQSGSRFLGITSQTSQPVNADPSTGIASPGGPWYACSYYDTTRTTAATAVATSLTMGQCSPAGATAYCNYIAVKFVVSNLGLSTQSVAISVASQNSGVSGADYSATALRTLINNGLYGTPQSVDWNDGAAAYTIPDCFWIRTPLYLNTIRLSCIRAIRYAP